MKKFTKWLEDIDQQPMLGGRPVEQIDAQVSLLGNQLHIASKQGTVVIELNPDQVQQFQQQAGNQQPNAGTLPQQGSLPWTNQGA